jgi:hypothetical protein
MAMALALALALAEPLEDSAGPTGQIPIHGHQIGIAQKQQVLNGLRHPAAEGYHQRLLEGAPARDNGPYP